VWEETLPIKKRRFYQHNGFINHIQVRSGGDDLFINEAATAQNIAISFTSESFTYPRQNILQGLVYAKEDK
jgi:hypothetical protein